MYKFLINSLLLTSCLFQSCSKTSEPTSILSIDGSYVGIAKVTIEEERWGGISSDTMIIHLDTMAMDVIEVTTDFTNDSIIKVERESEFFSSFYEFEGEQKYNANLQWFISYEYDKFWQTRLQIFPDHDSLSAYLLISDIFETEHLDEDDNLLFYSRFRKEYSIEALR